MLITFLAESNLNINDFKRKKLSKTKTVLEHNMPYTVFYPLANLDMLVVFSSMYVLFLTGAMLHMCYFLSLRFYCHEETM